MRHVATHRHTVLAALAAAATVLGATGSAQAQAAASDRAVALAGREEPPAWHRLVLTAGGALLQAHDNNESSAERGRFLLDAGYRPISWLEIAGRYSDSLGPWEYLSSHPALGGGLDRIQGFEHLHSIDLGARIDVPTALADRALPFHAWPYLGLGYLALRSEVLDSQAFGGGIGIGVGYDADSRTTFDASFYTMRAFSSSGGGDTAYGPVEGLEAWTLGVSLGAGDWTRLRLAYVGEALDRAHTTRESHGALFTFQVSLL